MTTLLPPDDWPNPRLVALREAIERGRYADDGMTEARWRRKVERMKLAEFGEGEGARWEKTVESSGRRTRGTPGMAAER